MPHRNYSLYKLTLPQAVPQSILQKLQTRGALHKSVPLALTEEGTALPLVSQGSPSVLAHGSLARREKRLPLAWPAVTLVLKNVSLTRDI